MSLVILGNLNLIIFASVFFLLVPVPLVDLALPQPQLLRYASDVLSCPVGVLLVLLLEDLDLIPILPLPSLDVPARC